MSESDHNDLIRQLVDVCKTDASTAQHYLEAYNWTLDDAVENLIADVEDENQNAPISEPIEFSRRAESQEAGTIPSRSTNRQPVVSSTKPRIATLSSISRKNPDESDSDDDKQAFYVGGAETGGGGQQVLGPRHGNDRPLISSTGTGGPSSRRNPDEFVQNVFRHAREGGAESLDYNRVPGEEAGSSTTMAFAGTGYRLGECLAEEIVSVPGEPIPESRKKVSVVVKMWEDGFSLDEGPLRSYFSPDSVAFMKSIKQGQIPSELIRETQNGEVHVMMEDHHTETWVAPPPPKAKAFSGTGHILGNPTPKVSYRNTVANLMSQHEGPTVDEGLPTTQVNIRFPDGSRLQVTLNHEHTVDDLRSAIMSQRPEFISVPFSLLTTFPRKDLTDGSVTLSAANLLNAAVVLSIK